MFKLSENKKFVIYENNYYQHRVRFMILISEIVSIYFSEVIAEKSQIFDKQSISLEPYSFFYITTKRSGKTNKPHSQDYNNALSDICTPDEYKELQDIISNN